jgi:tetratricopeptide (TPR) repeat protein
VAEQPSATAWMLDLLGGLHAMAGRPGETGGFLARAAAIREEVSLALVQAVGSADVGGYAWLWAGQPATAGQILQRACEALAQIGERNFYSTLAALLARAVEAGGGPDEEGERLAREAVVGAERTDLLNLRGDALLDLAEVLRLASRPAEAAEAGREALRRYQDKGNHASADQARGCSPRGRSAPAGRGRTPPRWSRVGAS